MKKLFASIFTAVLALALGVLIAACSNTPSVAGTYKFSSMTMSMGSETVTYNVGDKAEGVTLTEDYYVLTVNKDNTWTMASNFDGKTETTSGIWEEKDGKYVIKGDEEGNEIEATLDGNTITLKMGSFMTITLKK